MPAKKIEQYPVPTVRKNNDDSQDDGGGGEQATGSPRPGRSIICIAIVVLICIYLSLKDGISVVNYSTPKLTRAVDRGYMYPTRSEPRGNESGKPLENGTAFEKVKKAIASEDGDIVTIPGQTSYLCLIGKPYGYQNEANPGNSNFVLALSHALKYAKTVGKGVIVLVHKPFGSRYRLIFGEPDVQFLQLVERWPSKCTYKMTYKKSFYKFPFTEYTPILRLKDVYTAAAKKKIAEYRIMARGAKLVSVHRRWFIESGETRCMKRFERCPQFCTGCKEGGLAMTTKHYYSFSCTYTEKSVKDRFSTALPANAYIILFTDGQNPALDRQFEHIDKQRFFIQLAMMSMTDIHIENPASSIGKIVHSWRHQKKLPTFPRECYNYEH
jgi:hypothetical protein